MKNLVCPKCAVRMESFDQLGVEIDQCNNCGGVWLDKGEWTALTRGRGKEAITLEVVDRAPTDFVCPRCSHNLELGHHSEANDFQIEHCGHCGGSFFDRGEMVRLLARQ